MGRRIVAAASVLSCVGFAGLAVWAFVTHWPANSGEWASWAQAFGSILALALAIGLSVKARADAHDDAKEMARSYASQLAVIAATLVDACAKQKWAEFKAGRHALADACTIAQVVPFAQLRGNALAAFMSLRSMAIEIHVRSEEHTNLGHWEHWRSEFVDFGTQATKAIAMIDGAK